MTFILFDFVDYEKDLCIFFIFSIFITLLIVYILINLTTLMLNVYYLKMNLFHIDIEN